MKRSHVLSAGAAVLAVGALSYAVPSCAPREPKIGFPPLNQTITILPAAMNPTGPIRATDIDNVPGLRLTIVSGGRGLDADDTVVKFYKRHGSEKADLEITWGELRELYQSTGCTSDMIASLDGPGIGTALVCDGRIKIDDYVFIEATDAKGKTRSATSWATWRISDDIVGASIQLL